MCCVPPVTCTTSRPKNWVGSSAELGAQLPPALTLPAAVALCAFVWLLSLHPSASGRVYAAYGGVYVTVAIAWLWLVDGVRPSAWDAAGVALCLAGMAVIMLGAGTR